VWVLGRKAGNGRRSTTPPRKKVVEVGTNEGLRGRFGHEVLGKLNCEGKGEKKTKKCIEVHIHAK